MEFIIILFTFGLTPPVSEFGSRTESIKKKGSQREKRRGIGETKKGPRQGKIAVDGVTEVVKKTQAKAEQGKRLVGRFGNIVTLPEQNGQRVKTETFVQTAQG